MWNRRCVLRKTKASRVCVETTSHLRVRLVNQPSTHHQTIAVLMCLFRDHASSPATSGVQRETEFFQSILAFFSSELNMQQLVLSRGRHILYLLSSVTVVHLSWKRATPSMPTLFRYQQPVLDRSLSSCANDPIRDASARSPPPCRRSVLATPADASGIRSTAQMDVFRSSGTRCASLILALGAQGSDGRLRRPLFASKGRPVCANCKVARVRAAVSPLGITMAQR